MDAVSLGFVLIGIGWVLCGIGFLLVYQQQKLIARCDRRRKEMDELTRVREALGFGTEKDAYDNLLGASLDLERKGADPICVKTIERVLSQLAAAYRIVGGK